MVLHNLFHWFVISFQNHPQLGSISGLIFHQFVYFAPATL